MAGLLGSRPTAVGIHDLSRDLACCINYNIYDA